MMHMPPAATYPEYRILAEDLAEFNANIVG